MKAVKVERHAGTIVHDGKSVLAGPHVTVCEQVHFIVASQHSREKNGGAKSGGYHGRRASAQPHLCGSSGTVV